MAFHDHENNTLENTAVILFTQKYEDRLNQESTEKIILSTENQMNNYYQQRRYQYVQHYKPGTSMWLRVGAEEDKSTLYYIKNPQQNHRDQ